MGRSFVSSLFLHLRIVFGLILNLLAAFPMLSLLSRIPLRIASVVLAFACNTCPISFFSMHYYLHNIYHNSLGSNTSVFSMIQYFHG
ncbi:hypothetical protein HCUR_00738 [Holospora curviuscula]|uniref:Uncharacterized protein n=1 Tax=Holospora curviuscula TaxID=1082868 RepID=A0A2S5R8V9_9PROT|nr:hypothetical protein HCUR_00738 [Holospora curviuscula]